MLEHPGHIPIALLHSAVLARDIKAGEMVMRDDVEIRIQRPVGMVCSRTESSRRWSTHVMPSIAVCLTSHDRLDCARMTRKFSSSIHQPLRGRPPSSGAAAHPYLRTLCALRAAAAFAGALSLMRNAIGAAAAFKPDFLVMLDADVRLLKEDVLLADVAACRSLRSLIANLRMVDAAAQPFARLARECAGIVLSRTTASAAGIDPPPHAL